MIALQQLRDRWERWGIWLFLALFLVSLIPVIWLGRYARACADDYGYGIFTHYALRYGEPFLKAVLHTATGYYKSWQGTFTALGLMSLVPCIFSEGAYWLTPVVMLASLIGGTLKLCHTLIVRCLGGTRRQAAWVGLAILFLSIQCVPAPLHSFYWWNGAVYYTFTYGVMLLMVERLAALALARRGREIVWCVLPGALCAFLVGGSNYVSNLLGILIGGLFLLGFVLWDRRKLPWALVITGVQGICFAVSILAPGNAVRQAGEQAMEPLQAILVSVLQAGYDCLDYPCWIVLLVCLALTPVLWALTAGGFAFPWPGAVSALTFLLFAAQNTPHYYAASQAGPDRLRNIIFFSFFWLLVINGWYWLGWFRRALLPRLAGHRPGPVLRGGMTAWLLVSVLACAWIKLPWMTAGGCLRQLSDGSAAAFAAQHDARLEALLDPEQPNPRFVPIQSRPPYLFFTDITTDPAHWKNNVVAMYFRKESVALLDQG